MAITWSRILELIFVRLHHKCSETQADPHNANRGFFFSHMGWLMVRWEQELRVKFKKNGLAFGTFYVEPIFFCRKHPAVMKAGKTINMSDLESDSLLMFQHRHYLKCFLMAGFVLPTIIPNLLWGESLTNAYFMAVVRWNLAQIDFLFILALSPNFALSSFFNLDARYVSVLHFTWLVNSAAHMFGMKPYDENIGPSENRSSLLLDSPRNPKSITRIEIICYAPNPPQTCVSAGNG